MHEDLITIVSKNRPSEDTNTGVATGVGSPKVFHIKKKQQEKNSKFWKDKTKEK